ncbi:MAG: (2Fe-2S)-binding protein, partial [Rhodocyclaceae bacterium]|nr:(2Fe-2S)-binding protein [Rhodocyclaceae bacterium]
MSGYRLAAPHGAWIDRSRALRFDFNGVDVKGFAGDTVASALLGQGIGHIGRSFKLHRPRGIFSCGLEEPTGLVDIGVGRYRTPNTRATDIAAADGMTAKTGNAWPSLGLDLAAINNKFAALMPAGFYYKTFMWPDWHLFEPAIRRMAGLGVAADGPDPDRYDEVSQQVEVLVIGAGAAGMQAAMSAAQSGRQVLLLESGPHAGGWLESQSLRGEANSQQRLDELTRQVAAAGVSLRVNCTVLGLYDHQLAVALETVDDGTVRERLWKIRAERIILATGAIERPMLFPDNDRPGVMLASAVERYATHFGVACGKRIVVSTACDSGYDVAASLNAAGIEVAAIVDSRETIGPAAPMGVKVFLGSSIVAVSGSRAINRVTVAANRGGDAQAIAADCVASAGGWTPAVNLYSMAGGKLRWNDDASMFVPDLPL